MGSGWGYCEHCGDVPMDGEECSKPACRERREAARQAQEEREAARREWAAKTAKERKEAAREAERVFREQQETLRREAEEREAQRRRVEQAVAASPWLRKLEEHCTAYLGRQTPRLDDWLKEVRAQVKRWADGFDKEAPMPKPPPPPPAADAPPADVHASYAAHKRVHTALRRRCAAVGAACKAQQSDKTVARSHAALTAELRAETQQRVEEWRQSTGGWAASRHVDAAVIALGAPGQAAVMEAVMSADGILLGASRSLSARFAPALAKAEEMRAATARELLGATRAALLEAEEAMQQLWGRAGLLEALEGGATAAEGQRRRLEEEQQRQREEAEGKAARRKALALHEQLRQAKAAAKAAPKAPAAPPAAKAAKAAAAVSPSGGAFTPSFARPPPPLASSRAAPGQATRVRPRGSFIRDTSPAQRLSELSRSSKVAKRAAPSLGPSGAKPPPFWPCQAPAATTTAATAASGASSSASSAGEARHEFNLPDSEIPAHKVSRLNEVRKQVPNARISLVSGHDTRGTRQLTISGGAEHVRMAERLIEEIGVGLSRYRACNV